MPVFKTVILTKVYTVICLPWYSIYLTDNLYMEPPSVKAPRQIFLYMSGDIDFFEIPDFILASNRDRTGS